MVRRSIKSSASIVALHKAIEKPIGYPVNRSLTRPSGAAHHAGHGSARSSRHAIRMRKPKSGYQPLVDTIGRAARSEPKTTDAAGRNIAKRAGPWLNRRDEDSAARAIREPRTGCSK